MSFSLFNSVCREKLRKRKCGFRRLEMKKNNTDSTFPTLRNKFSSRFMKQKIPLKVSKQLVSFWPSHANVQHWDIEWIQWHWTSHVHVCPRAKRCRVHRRHYFNMLYWLKMTYLPITVGAAIGDNNKRQHMWGPQEFAMDNTVWFQLKIMSL